MTQAWHRIYEDQREKCQEYLKRIDLRPLADPHLEGHPGRRLFLYQGQEELLRRSRKPHSQLATSENQDQNCSDSNFADTLPLSSQPSQLSWSPFLSSWLPSWPLSLLSFAVLLQLQDSI